MSADSSTSGASAFWSLMRFRSLVTLPLLMVWLARYAHAASGAMLTPARVQTARYIMIGVAVYLLLACFLIERVFKRGAAAVRARGKDPERLIAQTTVASSVQPSFLAFIVCLLGGPERDVYIWSAVSFVAAWFWALRYRRVVFGVAEMNIAGRSDAT